MHPGKNKLCKLLYYTRSGFDDIASNLKCTYFEKEVSRRKKINNSWTTRMFFELAEFPFITSRWTTKEGLQEKAVFKLLG